MHLANNDTAIQKYIKKEQNYLNMFQQNNECFAVDGVHKVQMKLIHCNLFKDKRVSFCSRCNIMRLYNKARRVTICGIDGSLCRG